MSGIHRDRHPQARQVVEITSGDLKGKSYRIEDWWDRIAGKSWMDCHGNPACLQYAARSVGIPIDDEVVHGKIDSLGYLVHVSEFGEAA